MTTFRQFTCSVCGSPIEYGQYLPFRHTAGLRPNVRAHYALPSRPSTKGSAPVPIPHVGTVLAEPFVDGREAVLVASGGATE